MLMCVISSFATLMSIFIFLLSSPFLVLGECDFQKDFCTWTNLRGDQFDWTRRSGRTPSSGTGPDRDRLGTTSGNVRVNLSNTGPVSIITQVILAFWLVLTYDLLEDRRTDDDSARFNFLKIFWILNLNQSQFFAKHA